MASRKTNGPVPDGNQTKGKKILSKEEKLQQELKIHPELQSTLQGFDQFLKLSENRSDKLRVLKTLKSNISDPFNTYSTETARRLLGDYLAVKQLAEKLYDLYEFLVTATDANVFTGELLHKHQGTVEVKVMLEIRLVLWNWSDASLLLASSIANTNIFSYILADAKAISKTLPIISEDDLAFDTAVGILYNCAKNHETRPKYREMKAMDTMLPFLKAKSTKVKLTTLLLLAHIVDDSGNKHLTADTTVFDFLIEMIVKSWEDVDHRCYHGNTFFSTRELLCGLVALAKNDGNKKQLMDKGVMKPLEMILTSGNEKEQAEALNCIRELAFNDDNKSVLNANVPIMAAIKEREASNNKEIAKAAQFTRWGLATRKLMGDLKRKPSVIETQQPKSGHVMLSYSWANQTEVLKVHERLKGDGFRLWVDVDDMAGSTLGAMSAAVEDASVVVIFFSEMYYDSQNCRSEAEYAYKLKKMIVPVMLQANYNPIGWLGIILGAKLYYDFSPGPKIFNEKIKELIRALGQNGKITDDEAARLVPVSKGPPIQTLSAVPEEKKNDVAKWTNKNVTDWLKNNALYQCSSLRALTGEELMFLQTLSHQAPEFFYGYLERNLKLKSLKDLMMFSNAISKL